MPEISQRELRNDNAVVMRRVAAGESFTVTRRGKPVADLVPHDAGVTRHQFVDSTVVLAAFAELPVVDAEEWLGDIRESDSRLGDSDTDPWSPRG